MESTSGFLGLCGPANGLAQLKKSQHQLGSFSCFFFLNERSTAVLRLERGFMAPKKNALRTTGLEDRYMWNLCTDAECVKCVCFLCCLRNLSICITVCFESCVVIKTWAWKFNWSWFGLHFLSDEGPTSDEQLQNIPVHTTDLDYFKSQLAFLINVYAINFVSFLIVLIIECW